MIDQGYPQQNNNSFCYASGYSQLPSPALDVVAAVHSISGWGALNMAVFGSKPYTTGDF